MLEVLDSADEVDLLSLVTKFLFLLAATLHEETEGFGLFNINCHGKSNEWSNFCGAMNDSNNNSSSHFYSTVSH